MTSLVKKLDAAIASNKSARIKSAVVLMTDDEGAEKKLKDLNVKAGLKNVSLGVDNPAGPSAWKVAKEAEVTVVFYRNRDFKANHAFRRGELNDAGIERVIADISKITK